MYTTVSAASTGKKDKYLVDKRHTVTREHFSLWMKSAVVSMQTTSYTLYKDLDKCARMHTYTHSSADNLRHDG